MSVGFKGDTSWRFIKGRRSSLANGLPTREHTWTGGYDRLEDFLETYPIGEAHEGGYIIGHDITDTAPKAEVDLILAKPPDFDDFVPKPFTSTNVFTKTAEVDDDELFPVEVESIVATRRVTARCYGTHYQYFASTQPEDARYNTTVTGKNPKILEEEIEVVGKLEATEDNPNPGELVLRYRTFASAPSSVRAAVNMSVVNTVVNWDAEPIRGTPWYEGNDSVLRGYEAEDEAA